MVDTKNTAIRAYIKHVLTKRQWSPPALAKQAGISPSTITRFLNSKDYKFVPSMSTINKIAMASGISPAPFFDGKEIDLSDDKTWDDFHSLLQTELDRIQKDAIFVLGEIRVGSWTNTRLDLITTDNQIRGVINIKIRESNGNEGIFGMEVKDASAAKLAREGDKIIFISTRRSDPDIEDGTLVLVERQRDEGLQREITARIATRDSAEKWSLRFANDDHAFSEVLHCAPVLEDSPRIRAAMLRPEEAKIIGVALLILREPIVRRGASAR